MEPTYRKENRRHSSKLVPFSYYESYIPAYFDMVPLHWHKEFEINYIIRGYGQFICGEEKFIAREGEIILLPPNMLHAIFPCQNQEFLYDTLVFHPELLGSVGNDRCTVEIVHPIISGDLRIRTHITGSHAAYPRLRDAVSRIMAAVKENSPRADLLLKSELFRLFWILTDSRDIFVNDRPRRDNRDAIRPAISYMESHYRETVTVDMLAALSHRSRSSFMSCFRKAAGVGAIEYLTQYRIRMACELLISTDRNISEIALDCGFQNLSNFNRLFRHSVGLTPSGYRAEKERARFGYHEFGST